MLAPFVPLALLLSAAPAPGADPRLPVLDAMKSELARSMSRLRLKDQEPPYFISYQVKDYAQDEITAKFGSLFDASKRHDRKMFVDVRVGSYDFDSSGGDDLSMFMGNDGQSYYPSRDAPLDGDETALRNALWLLTDSQYKGALSSFLKKKAKNVYEPDDPDRAPSFSREPAQQHVDAPLPYTFDRARWERDTRELSLLFRDHPDVFDSDVKVTGEKQIRWFTSSEGAALVTEQTIYGLHVEAVARAVDGQLLQNSRDYYGATEAELPSLAKAKADALEMIRQLEALRTAPVIDPYTGPAILAPEATGVLFHEAVGHRLEGDRQDDDKDGRTFKGQTGKQVLPAFLTIVDDPSLRFQGATPLNGYYEYDEQGVPGQRTVLVKDGVLQTYLLSRRAVKPFLHSNGHGRSQGGRPPVARMANLVVLSTKVVSRAELKWRLIAEAKRQGKPYGLMIEDITGGNTNTMTYGYQAFKGTPRMVYRVDVKTGKEQLVRGVELVGTPLASINKLSATSDEVRVFNGYCGAESGFVPVSTVAPAALIDEIELQRTAKENERNPVLPAPWSETAKPGPR